MHTMFEQHVERLNRLNRDPRTIQMATRILERFDAYLEELGVAPADVEGWMIEEYLPGTGRTKNTRQCHLTYIGAAYRYARKRRQVQFDPTDGVRLPSEPDKEPKILTASELRAVYGAIEDRTEEIGFHLLAYAGLRRTEAARLREEHVDLESSTLTVHGKHGKLRKVPIHPALWEVLDRRMDGEGFRPLLRSWGIRQLQHEYFGKRMSMLAERAGVAATPHDFRRTMASSLYANDVPEHTIDKIMGWAPRTVGRKFYLRVADDKLQKAILRLYQDAPISNPPKRGGLPVVRS